MKIMTLSQHEKHENSMAGVVNLRLGGVQKAGKMESEKTKKTRKFRHPKKRKKTGKKSCGTAGTAQGRRVRPRMRRPWLHTSSLISKLN